MAEVQDEMNSSSGEELDVDDEVDRGVVKRLNGVDLYLNESDHGTNTYKGVYKIGPNRWLAKIWLSREGHRTIGEYRTEEAAAYAYATFKNGQHSSRGPANPHQSTTTTAADQRPVHQCQRNATCTRKNRHPGQCKLPSAVGKRSSHGPRRVQPQREARSSSAGADASAAAAASPSRGRGRPARQSAGPTSPGSAASAPGRADQSPASAPGSFTSTGSTSTGKFAIDSMIEIQKRIDAGMTKEEAQNLLRMTREAFCA